jgi:hypothetical protein
MTGTYPFESCCQPKNGRKGNAQEEECIEEVKIGTMETQEMTETKTKTSTVNSMLDDVDPDYGCLPFWTGFFVISSQLFIYTVVIANVFQR